MATENENLDMNVTPETPTEPEITLEDLQKQLAAAKADNERYKNAISKSNTEAAEWKRKFRERQTAEEAAADAKREAEALQQEQMESIKRELSVLKATNLYLKQGMDEKAAAECAEMQSDGDIENLIAKISAHFSSRKDAEIKAWQEEYLKSRPDIKAGHGEDGEPEEDPFVKAFKNPDAY
jgi:hypothetical protein